MKRVRRFLAGCLVIVGIVALFIAFSEPGKAIQDLWRNGAIQAYLTPKQNRTYIATSDGNLRAMYTALELYHDDEGHFPEAKGWMDAIENRIVANDLPLAEARKKLIRPDLTPPRNGVYGYAMNDQASGKYKGDIKNPDLPLIFESSDTERNAHGDPGREKGREAITIDGKIVRL